MKPKTAINPTRNEDYAQWYQAVIQASDLAEHAPVRGCMTIKPWGYRLWEIIQQHLDSKIKALGHENIYCPMMIPLEFLEKEASHVEGFAKECAVVTHSKLTQQADGSLVPSSPLEKPYILRPTSETLIGELMSRWIQSYRDLPLLLNQWANVVRWEMRTRLFLRTTEFLWQEGHTAHATDNEAKAHAKTMLAVYQAFCEDILAMPVIPGTKSKNETFPGAEITYTIEAIMQDHKALQLGTSHFLGQKFTEASQVKFQGKDGQMHTPWSTSWGLTTRLIGGLIMTHADDDGLICPPRVAPYQIIIMPIIKKSQDPKPLLDYCQSLVLSIASLSYAGEAIRVKLDDRELSGGEKNWHWIKKGVPIRIHIGENERLNQTVTMQIRTSGPGKKSLAITDFLEQLEQQLEHIQDLIYQKASDQLYSDLILIESIESITEHFNQATPKPVAVYWIDDDELEQSLQQSHKLSIRCYPHPHPKIPWQPTGPALCNPSKVGKLAILAKSY